MFGAASVGDQHSSPCPEADGLPEHLGGGAEVHGARCCLQAFPPAPCTLPGCVWALCVQSGQSHTSLSADPGL